MAEMCILVDENDAITGAESKKNSMALGAHVCWAAHPCRCFVAQRT